MPKIFYTELFFNKKNIFINIALIFGLVKFSNFEFTVREKRRSYYWFFLIFFITKQLFLIQLKKKRVSELYKLKVTAIERKEQSCKSNKASYLLGHIS